MSIKKEIIINVDADQANKELEKVKTNVNANTDAVDGMTNSIDKMSGGLVGMFKSIVSGAKAGVTAMMTLKGALIATGIGALVVAVGSLYSYFTKTEEGAQKLRIAFSAVGAVVDKLIDGFIAVGKFLGKIASITGSVISGNKSLSEGWNDAKDAGKQMGKEIVEAYNSIGSAVEKAMELQRRENELRKGNRQDMIDEAKLMVKLSEAREIAADSENDRLTRIKALNEAEKLTADLFKMKIEDAKEELEIQKERNKLASASEEDLEKEAELTAKLIQLEADQNNATRGFMKMRSNMRKAETAEAEAEVLAKQKALDDRNKLIDSQIESDIKKEEERLAKIQAVNDTFKQKNEDAQAQTELDRIMLQQSRDMASLNALDATEQQKYEVKKYYEDQIFKYQEQKAKEKKALDMAVAMASVNIAGQTASLLSMMVKKDSKAYKVLQIAQVSASGIQAVQNAYTTASASPITAVFPAYPYIQAGFAGAFSAMQLARIKNSDTNSGAVSSPRGDAGGGSPQSPPQFNVVAGTGSNQIAEGLNSNKTVLKTYVVGSEVSSQQELDRKIVKTASI